MAKILVILVVALVFEALGVVILKQGINQITAREKCSKAAGSSESPRCCAIGTGSQTRSILLGVFFEAIFFVGLLYSAWATATSAWSGR